MNTDKDGHLWQALEGLRHSKTVEESRQYVQGIASAKAVRSRRRWVITAGASLAAVAAAAVLFMVAPQYPGSDLGALETAIGEIRTTELEDKSLVTMDTASRIEVKFSSQERRVHLVKGQASFKVSPDSKRPFHVRVGHTEITALGTVFDVAALGQQTTITLIEGSVQVRVENAVDREVEIKYLKPGQQLNVDAEGPSVHDITSRLPIITAWQQGLINLDNVTLDEALREINRYSITRIHVSDPTLAAQRFSAVFRAGDTDAIVPALESFFGVTADRQSDQGIVLNRN